MRIRSIKCLPILLILLWCLSSCYEKDPNENTYSEKVLETQEIKGVLPTELAVVDSVYVPIYSDIYSRSKDTCFLLTATLSIRNTSFTDTLIIKTIDYYDTQGDLVNEYLNEPIFLAPMASIDYVIDEEDESGGSGANFIVVWASEAQQVKPVIQAVMIATNGQQGVAFTTEGVSISK